MAKEQFHKLASFTEWFDNAQETDRFIVLVKLCPGAKTPSFILPEDIRTEKEGISEPDLIAAYLSASEFRKLDSDNAVLLWTVDRRAGVIEFSEADIWNAVVAHQSLFSPFAKFETDMAKFKEHDSIGYSEIMRNMKEVLYVALGYCNAKHSPTSHSQT